MDKELKEVLNKLIEGLPAGNCHFIIMVGQPIKGTEQVETVLGMGGNEEDLIHTLEDFMQRNPELTQLLKLAVLKNTLESVHAGWIHEDAKQKGKIN